ncbi:hypothetical protein GCM10028806_44680 [Spirosoma terrae]|uniref:DUF3052 domain-containing protein n=1 Tax=Spirosoma terrae TaxID=1968276 RepID=A0A6L9L055_9BACT|nr:hypothetical protein [Spirosoma terrae]NDU93864.1 hypothetical protein [Spirosoma terrae]
MHPVLAKLNYKAQPEIAVINAPDEFLAVVDTVRLLATIVTDPQQIQLGTFVIAFVKNQAELDTVSHALAQRTKGDSILWIAYPKGSSRKYTCDFNRDTGWAILGELGFEGVRMVAIDEDWSALRFRRVEYIKKMTRQSNRAMTESGKQKTAK